MVVRKYGIKGLAMVEGACVICGTHVRRKGFRVVRYCSHACRAEAQRRQRPVDRDWLYQKYVVEALGAPEIAAIVGRHPKRVWEWLRDVGIPTRPRGDSPQARAARASLPNPNRGKTLSAERRAALRAARARDGGVPYLKNGVHHLKGKRGADTPNWKGGITPQRQAFYCTQTWKDAVRAVWQRDNAICRRCGLDHRTVEHGADPFTIHHVIGFENVALRAEPSNLVLLCQACHRFVHSKANREREFLQ